MPDTIRALGFIVHTMAEVYPGGEEERILDERWIADADAAGWVALTKDERIIRFPHEQAALKAGRLRVFAIGNQHLTGPQMAGYFRTTSTVSCSAPAGRGPSWMSSSRAASSDVGHASRR